MCIRDSNYTMETAFPQLIFAVIVCGKMLGVRLGPFAVYALHTNDPQLGVQKVLLRCV